MGGGGVGGGGLWEKPHLEDKTVFAHLCGGKKWGAAVRLAGRQISSKLGVGRTDRCVHCVPFMVYGLCNRVLVVSYAD